MLDPVNSQFYLQRERGGALLYHDLNHGHLDSISSSVKVEGAVCLHALWTFPEFLDSFLFSLFVGKGGIPPWDAERFQRSVLLFLPG